MLTKISTALIKLYQQIPGPWHNNCRFYPTCSNYTLEAINKYGAIKGWYLGLKRILKCNPLGGHGYDPVPNNLKQRKKTPH